MRSDKKAEFGPKFGVGTPLYRHHTTSLVFNDPPLHTRVRKLLAAAFTPRALANLQPRIEAVVDGLLYQHADSGAMDLVEDFAFRLPVEVICDMLGVPPGDRASFRRYSLAILGALEPVAGPERQERGNAAVAEFSPYLDGLVAERRRRPADDRDTGWPATAPPSAAAAPASAASIAIRSRGIRRCSSGARHHRANIWRFLQIRWGNPGTPALSSPPQLCWGGAPAGGGGVISHGTAVVCGS